MSALAQWLMIFGGMVKKQDVKPVSRNWPFKDCNGKTI